MASQLQKLMFSMSLLDKVSGPAGRIKKTLTGVSDSASSAFKKIGAGTAGIAVTGAALTMLASPAHSLNMAMGEVESLGVGESTLQNLANDAVAFSVKYGGSASEVVRSSYDIQSAIAGLEGNDLSSFTISSGVLAKATKSDAATITDYMGTMYGIFGDNANMMGNGKWVDQLTGQTATAVQMFKTTGSEMASSFSSLGASATSAGIKQANQMAILGSLQATMSGSEAGTKYKSFLAGVGGAQEKLGLEFVDNQGKMLGMVTILDKLKGKYGDVITVAEKEEIKNAFGSDEAVALIDLLLPKTDSLAESISSLGNITGMEKAEQMASTMIDPFEQWQSGVSAVSTGLGQALLPVLYPVMSAMAAASGKLYKWTQAHPTLTRYLGYTVLGVTALVAGVSLFGVVVGMASLAATGFGIVMAIVTSPITLIVLAIGAVIGGIAALIIYWDDLKAHFADVGWIQTTMEWIEKLVGKLSFVADAVSWIGNAFNSMISDGEISVPKTSPSLAAANRRERINGGGVSQHVANSINSTSSSKSSTTNIGSVTTSRPINSQEMSGMATMAGT
ncbi:MAG: phage tail tape measure protein [Desulfotalea sp.]